MANGFQRSGFQHPGFQAMGVVPAGPTYGGVWLYGLKHWRRLRGEEDYPADQPSKEPEPEPAMLERIASVMRRAPYPEQEAQAKILLRLELERQGLAWNQIYLAAFEAYQAGFQDYLEELRAQDRARRVLMEDAIAKKRSWRRRLAAFLLLDV